MNLDDYLADMGEEPLDPSEVEQIKALDRLLSMLEQAETPWGAEEGGDLLKTLSPLCRSAFLFRRSAGLLSDRGSSFGDTLQGASIPPATPLPDPFPGEFRLVRLLGEGTFGKVYLAEEVRLRRLVALKTLRYAGDQQRLAALEHEAGLLAQFSHRNLVQVFSWRTSGGDHYLVLQYVEGGSLLDRLDREKALPWESAARYIADIGEGLREVHERGIIHRDIKPANILWNRQRDEALLTDFGVAALLSDDRSVGGTPLYMAPEGFSEGNVSPKLDVYSLAATLFHLVAGEPPFNATTATELHEQIQRGLPAVDARCGDLPGPLEQVLRAGLSADPAQRPELKEFVASLRGRLNQSLADSLVPVEAVGTVRPVELRLAVSKEVAPGHYAPVAATHPSADALVRNMTKVPRPPEQVRLRTGDRVRVEVIADRTGYVTVFNVGPTGDLNLLFPDDPPPPATPPTIRANEPLHVLDVEMEPPVGRERLFAVWTRHPLALQPEQMQAVADRTEIPASERYQASRNMARVKRVVQQLRPEDWQVVVLEVNHSP